MAKFNVDRFLKILAKLAPVLIPLVPGGAKLTPLIPVIVEAIGAAQALDGVNGETKKAHAMEAIHMEAARLKIDPVLVQEAASTSIDALVNAAKPIARAAP